MPKGIYKRTEEHCRNMGLVRIGKPTGRKGYKATKETRDKLRLSHLGKRAWNKGLVNIYTLESKNKIRIGVIKSGKGFQKGYRPWNYKGNPTSESRKVRGSIENRLWRESVFARDHWNCQNCGTNGVIHAHHIKPFAEHPELRFAIDNGITLCIKCHKQLHIAAQKKTF